MARESLLISTEYPCDFCGDSLKVSVTCSTCKAGYCSVYCSNEDRITHSTLCGNIGGDAEKNTDRILKLLEINKTSFSFLKDSLEREYIPFPGKIDGTTPPCMLSLYDKDGFGRRVWNTMDIPSAMLEVWYYLVRVEDLTKMLSRMGKEEVVNLFILMEKSQLNKKRST